MRLVFISRVGKVLSPCVLMVCGFNKNLLVSGVAGAYSAFFCDDKICYVCFLLRVFVEDGLWCWLVLVNF